MNGTVEPSSSSAMAAATCASPALRRNSHAREAQVAAAIALFDGGSTVPFIARYRKEATGGLDDIQLRTLDERLATCARWRIGAPRS